MVELKLHMWLSGSHLYYDIPSTCIWLSSEEQKISDFKSVLRPQVHREAPTPNFLLLSLLPYPPLMVSSCFVPYSNPSHLLASLTFRFLLTVFFPAAS